MRVIYVDENALNEKKSKVSSARQTIQEVQGALNPEKLDTARLSESSAIYKALSSQLSKANKDLQRLSEKCDQTMKYIDTAIQEYKRTDSSLAKSSGD